jgi:hypothetical protein
MILDLNVKKIKKNNKIYEMKNIYALKKREEFNKKFNE